MNTRSTVTLASNGRYWQAFYQDANGQRRAKGLGSKEKLSRRQAKILCDRLAAELQSNPSKAGGSVPRLGAFLENYLNSRTDVRPSTKYLHELTGRYLKQHFGADIRIDRITRAMAASWRAALACGELKDARENHQYQIMNETSVCQRTCDAKTIFNHAVRDDIIAINPFARLRSRAPETDKDWHYVSIEQFDKLCIACPSTAWRLLIGLCRFAGLRRGEALAITWDAVDWGKHRLKVIAEKTGRRRLIPIEPRLYDMLEKAREQNVDPGARVCPVTAHCIWRNFTVIRKRAGLPP